MSTDNTSPELLSRIMSALEEIRPFLIEDGGDVEIVRVTEDMVVEVEFQGACKTCSMSNMTFTAGIQQAIIKAVPEVRDVVAVTREIA